MKASVGILRNAGNNLFFKIQIFLMMRTISILLIFFLGTSFKLPNDNYSEYHKSISALIKKICTLKGYEINEINGNWVAKSKNGFYSFEGVVNSKEKYDDYTIKIKGIIYSQDYFKKQPSFNIPYVIHRTTNVANTASLIINTSTESFDDLPFNVEEIEVAFMEKEIGLPYSEEIVFNRYSFVEVYIVLFKDKKIKKYYIDPVTREFFEQLGE